MSWNGVLVFVLFLVHRIVVNKFASLWYGAPPVKTRQEQELEKEIAELKLNAKKLHRMDTFVEYAKTTRLIGAKEKELAKMREASAAKYESIPMLWRRLIPIVQESLLPFFCYFWFHNYLFGSLCPVATHDSSCWSFGGEWISSFFGTWLAWPLEPHRSGAIPYGSIGVLSWIIFCQGAVKVLLSAFKAS